jgi:hypothetical protein
MNERFCQALLNIESIATLTGAKSAGAVGRLFSIERNSLLVSLNGFSAATRLFRLSSVCTLQGLRLKYSKVCRHTKHFNFSKKN